MPTVSVLIPSRNEPYLRPTVVDALRQATGDVEVIVVLDGWWPDPPLPEDPRLHVLHWGTAQGLRPSLNAAAQMAKGDFLFKLDAHCALAHGYDETLSAACGTEDVVVPAKYSLDAQTWTPFKDPWLYYYLKWPWPPDGKFVGLQDKNYPPEVNAEKAHLPIDDILSYQGSAWMLRRAYWHRLLPDGMDAEHYYFAQEPQEVGLKAWLTGGRVRIVKTTWYAHLWKGRSNKRQFLRHRDKWDAAMLWSTRHWLLDEEPGCQYSFSWLIDKFGLLPGWPMDWEQEAHRRLIA